MNKHDLSVLEPPRKLRLSTILAELDDTPPPTARCRKCGHDLRGQTQARCPECGDEFDPALIRQAQEPPAAAQTDTAGPDRVPVTQDGESRDNPPAAEPRHEPASGHRRRFRHRKPSPRSHITVGEIVDRTTEAGFGFLVGFLALTAIPFFGLSTPFGLAIAFVALQMIAGRHRPWLPKRIRNHPITMKTLNWLSNKVARWTAGLERIIRPRLTVFARGPFWTLCGIGILIQGLCLALPLPIPGSNWIFIIPAILYAIGLLELDGLLILICHGICLIQAVLAVLFSEALIGAFKAVGRWFSGWL